MLHSIEYAPPKVDRRFWSILLISVLIHAAAMAWTRGMITTQQPELPPLMATLRAMVTTPTLPSEQLAEPTPALVPPKVRQRIARAESPATPVMTTAAGPAGNTFQVPVVAAAAATDVQAAPAVVPAIPTQASSSAPSQDELLANYRRRLTDLLARHQEYPRVAAMRGWEGEVRVRVRVARKGSLLGVTLDHSSGYEILDKHALAMLEGLGGLPALPDGFGPSELQVVVPVSYSLRNPT